MRKLNLLALASIMTIGCSTAATAAQEKVQRPYLGKAGGKDVLKTVDPTARDVLKTAKPGDLQALAATCEGERFEVRADGYSGDRELQFVICADGDEPMLTALERAETDLLKNEALPADRKSDLLARVRAKISDLRARG